MYKAEPLLVMEDIEKRFLGVAALQGASLQVAHGEVHALIGQNGAGKSTLLKILTGAYRRDGGKIAFEEKVVDFHTPHAAQANGISTIYQEVNLVPSRSVSENIFMGRELRRFGWLKWKQMHAEAKAILARFEIEIDVTRPLSNYNVATQQMVAIARAVSFQSKLVIMDEPTSSLDDHEVATLFKVIRQLKAANVSIIFVSHRLDELYAVCDRVTVMRDGQTVATTPMQAISKMELVAKMLGKELSEVRQVGQTAFNETHHQASQPLLEANGLQGGHKLRGVDVTVHAGEIVGLAGLLGSGRTEAARAIFGADALAGGSVKLSGEELHFKSPKDAIRRGIGFCSEDRKTEGIIPYLSVQDNLTLALLPKLRQRGIISKEKQAAVVARYIKQLDIKTAGPHQKIRELSGGNQQKVLLARWLCLNPRLLILDEPTRGIDVGAKAEIQALIGDLATKGLGVLMISSELEELTEGCAQVVVLRDGQSVAQLTKANLSQEAIMTAMAHGSMEQTQVQEQQIQEESTTHG
jgi:ribose transport system ATP-binding protein